MNDSDRIIRDGHTYFLGLPIGTGKYDAEENVFLLTGLGGASIAREDTGYVDWTVEQTEEK